MELRSFAEQVLFGTRLEDKLRAPEDITDESPGSSIAAPAFPGRPPGLRFKPRQGSGVDFPGLDRLERADERGRLLHFFANHELLATELMALALLRFPDAPSAFRRGLLRTLQDEQEHTRWYVERMRAFGIGFGDLPVSGFFWRSVSAMQHPIDYVSGLCLTFEQANLDFCRDYSRAFGTVGDAESCRLLDRIYHDEIGHVAYGLKWFRRWKDPRASDWDAFCRQLALPLSPQRAKGFSFNAEGRRAAGLDPDFIARLEVYARSRGRTPTVFVFNPFAEGFIAGGGTFHPTGIQSALAGDLSHLPMFLGRQDDVVLVSRPPGREFLAGLQRAGFSLPEFVTLPNREDAAMARPPEATANSSTNSNDSVAAESAAFASLVGRPLGRLRPWAWGPDSRDLMEPLFASVTGESRSAGERYSEAVARLYSKGWSVRFLEALLGDLGTRTDAGDLESWICTRDDVGVEVETIDEAWRVIEGIRARGHHRVVVKEDYGLAGANASRLWEPEVLATQRRWMERAIAAGRRLVVEPWLERVIDFSVQVEMEDRGARLIGYTGLVTDQRGQFRANWAEPDYGRRLPARVAACFPGVRDLAGRLVRLYSALVDRLADALRGAGYRGPVGIDAFVYRTAAGEPRLKPVVEINPRHTMGRVTIELMRQVCPGCRGEFRLVSRADLRREGCADFAEYARRMAERWPLRREGEPVPRIREGFLCLSEPDRARVCLATFRVEAKAAKEFASPGPGRA